MNFDQLLIVTKPNAPAAGVIAEELSQQAERAGIPCHHVTDTLPTLQQKPLMMVLGGDGTFLNAANLAFGHAIPLTGINLGHLGFLTDLDADDLSSHWVSLMNGDIFTDERPYFTFTLKRANQVIIEDQPFINDAVLHRPAEGKMLCFNVHVRDRLMLENTRADGLIISTPTGSTAYNLSAGGPIAHPESNCLILSPICPHTLSFRPVVIPAFSVTVSLDSEAGSISLDGRETHDIQQGDQILIQPTAHKLTLWHTERRNFFHVLRQKMGWSA